LTKPIRSASVVLICGVTTACDIVLASSSARFGYPELKIGFVPAMVMAILRRNVSEKRAFDRKVDAYARAFEKVSASAVALSKKLLYQMDGMAFVEAVQSGVDVNAIARMTDDCRQGIARFLK
jgi:methylglutaconyl-CoA hydratase